MSIAVAGRGPRQRTTAALVVVLALSACTPSIPGLPRTTPPASSPLASPTATFTFGSVADPPGLDPALASDTEAYRVTRQMMEGLVGVDPLTSEPAPLLAESWQEQDDGRSYTFDLKSNVLFHDGEPFNSEAVCANFERWFTMPAAVQQTAPALAFKSVFTALATDAKNSSYESCEALAPERVRINLTERVTEFIPSLALPAFAMASPKALDELVANKLTETRGEGVRLSRFALAPVGTGPYRFVSWDDGVVVLDSFKDYWGARGEIKTIRFVTISHPDARLRALTAGTIDAYDLVTVDNASELARRGFQLIQRDPYSVLYLGLNHEFPGVDDEKFRQAVAHAIDKPELIKGRFLSGTKPAESFIPSKLGIGTDTLSAYEYDPELARDLLEASGYDGAELPFYYPRNVARPYLPAPEKIYAALSRQLTAVGFNLKPVPIDWTDNYLATVQSPGDRAFHLLGWSGSYQDPDNFVGTLFGARSDEFGFTDNQLFSKINRAKTLLPGDLRTEAYQGISEQISRKIPAVPLAFPVSGLAVSSRVASYPVSPVMDEVFNRIDLTDVDTDPPTG